MDASVSELQLHHQDLETLNFIISNANDSKMLDIRFLLGGYVFVLRYDLDAEDESLDVAENESTDVSEDERMSMSADDGDMASFTFGRSGVQGVRLIKSGNFTTFSVALSCRSAVEFSFTNSLSNFTSLTWSRKSPMSPSYCSISFLSSSREAGISEGRPSFSQSFSPRIK